MNGSHDPTRAPAAERPSLPRAGAIVRPIAHLLALWAFAIAQPVYDVLGRNGEFFIAHRTRPVDLFLFAAAVSLVLPLVVVAPYLIARALSPRAGRVVLVGLVGLLCTLVVSQVMAHRVTLSVATHFAVAGGLGAVAALAYATRPGIQTFLTWLSPSVLIFPAIFLFQPSMSMFVRPDGRDAAAAATIDTHVPPIVFLVFDQLPLVSLMDPSGRIDRERYPGFAALADNATWYRGATTVGEFTGWALPPIVSGIRPNAQRVPTTRSYPHNLFTWLGARYRLEVQEPITQLCPERLCDSRRPPLPIRLASMTLDSAVVYLTVALPAGLRTYLPPLTENWKDFIHDQRWQRRWVAESRDDRRQVPRDLIASIRRDDPQPTLYFAHALLPHEPYIYLRSGQEFTADPQMPGITRTGRWTTDDWPVTEAYLRHLLQLEYVDGVVAQVIARLQAEGLYEQSLIVVTSDHGASFRPGGQFKALEAGNAAEIMSVPLFIKAPGQRQAVIDDSNIESVDIMPSIASRIGVPLTWTSEGVAAGTARPQRTTKTIRHGGARLQTAFDADALMKARDAAVGRKVALFGDAPGWRPAAVSHRHLIGNPVASLESIDGPWQAVVNDPDALAAVDPAGPRIPARITGWVRDARGNPADVEMVIAVNGIVAAVTRTFRPEDAGRGTWSALADPALLKKGRNDVSVYVVAPDTGTFHLAYASRARPPHLDLASRGAEEFWGVRQSGFHPREGSPVPHRWTTGDGVLVVPLEPDRLPKSLRVGLGDLPQGGTTLAVSVNGCSLFSGRADQAPWYRTFSLGQCPPATLSAPEARVVIKSTAWTSPQGRRQGVAVQAVNLLESDWPLLEDAALEERGEIRMAGPRDREQPAGEPMPIEVINTGQSTWLPPDDAPPGVTPVQIGLRWQRRSGGATAEQRLNLPHAIYPADRVVIDIPVVPPAELRDRGPWTVSITLSGQDGSAIPLASPLTVSVHEPGTSPP